MMPSFVILDDELNQALEILEQRARARQRQLANELDQAVFPELATCADCDTDCLEIVGEGRPAVEACARYAPEQGYCPFLD